MEQSEGRNDARAYRTPTIEDYGDLVELTAGVGVGEACEDATVKAQVCALPSGV